MTRKRLSDSKHLRTRFVEICSHDADHIMQELYGVIVNYFVDTGSYEFRRCAIERCVKKRTLREEVRAANKSRKITSKQELCSTCHLSDEQDEDGTKWIQCTMCHRWYHENCLQITHKQVDKFANCDSWQCALCESLGADHEPDSEHDGA